MEPEPRAIGSNDKDLQPGQKVGEYVVEAKIGEGGFGTVFRAAHPLIGKLAAVKVLNRQYSSDPEMVSRFVAEARAVNQIRHRNIIDIFAFGQLEDGRSYYVMELLDGQPLDESLAKGNAVPLDQAIPILRSVARALDAAHAKGIAHRDLKPENIFLVHESDDTIFPKLLDFGIAKLLGTASSGAMHKTRTGAPIGTPYYMSPEQCRGRDVDHRTDIYAFGVVTYRVLTGVVPFDGEDYMDILLKQIGEEPTPPSQINPALPRAVDDAVAWMMKKDPAARPPNLITAMRALEEAAQAAGLSFNTDQPSGLHASQTSRVAVQRTPSAITPLPRRPNDSSQPSFGGADTIDAARLSEVMQARSAAPTPGPAELPTPARRSPMIWIVAMIGALAVGTVVFFAVRSQKRTPDGVAANDPAEKPAVAPDAAAAVVTPPDPVGAGSGSVGGTLVPPPARLVKITIAGPPAGTEVYGSRGLLGVAPGDVQLDRSDEEIVLTFKAEGYVVASRTVTPTADQALEVTLDKKATDPVVKDPKGGKGGKGGKGDAGKGGKGDKGGKGKGSGSGSGTGRDTLEDPFGNTTK